MASLSIPRALFTVISLISLTSGWRLVDRYDGNNWQSKFDIYDKGWTNYEFATWVNWADPALIQNRNGQLYMGIGKGTWVPKEGPYTMEIRSKAIYARNNTLQSPTANSNKLLLVADFAHIPSNKCGVWPSFWLNGLAEPWPAGGEIDLLEGVNLMAENQITIHSRLGCQPTTPTITVVKDAGPAGIASATTQDDQSGQHMGEKDCGAGLGLVGCGVINKNTTSFGDGFNAAGGGIVAMELTPSSIKIWQWPRSAIPADLSSDPPNSILWGRPVANWVGCDFNKYFADLQVILDTKFCGGWAGQEYVWPASGCPRRKGQTCDEFVRENWGSYYDGVYWLVNFIKVYT